MTSVPRPYLVVPKLIEQPTWGGQYIVESKGWSDRDGLGEVKIGQSYEMFSGSNLSLVDSTDDQDFFGELTDNIAVETPTQLPHTVALADLVATDPVAILGEEVVRERGDKIELLIKFTQALGNSFQVHIRAGLQHPAWKPKPEAWYFFEPGSITLGVKLTTDWAEYETAVRAIEAEMKALSAKVQSGEVPADQVQAAASEIVANHNPRQYVNAVKVQKGQIADLSAGGMHHSWEEDHEHAPLGNVLLELQAEAMDSVSTFRSFDNGKIGNDGKLRDVHIDEYFEAIDTSLEANDPAYHIREPETVTRDATYMYEAVLDSPYYKMDKLSLLVEGAYEETFKRYKHIFVMSGRVRVESSGHILTIGTGHSCFVPANCASMRIKSLTQGAEVLISY